MTKRDTHRFKRGFMGCLGLLAALTLACYIAFKIYDYRFEQRRFPARISVTGTIYKVEHAWGFGPGGNETGLVVYEIDQAEARRLVREAPSLVDDASIRKSLGRAERDYGEWRRTPVDTSESDRWPRGDRSIRVSGAPLITSYLNRYGFGISVDKAIASEIDRTLSSPGAYYAFGRGGSLIVIAPTESRVIFAYAG